MPLYIHYRELGPDHDTRLQRLKALIDLAGKESGDIWDGIDEIPPHDVGDVLQLSGMTDNIEWRQGVPYVKQAPGGYILIGLTNLVEDIPGPINDNSLPYTRFGPADYSLELGRLGSAATSLLTEHLKHKE